MLIRPYVDTKEALKRVEMSCCNWVDADSRLLVQVSTLMLLGNVS